jgi:hypothetical protein
MDGSHCTGDGGSAGGRRGSRLFRRAVPMHHRQIALLMIAQQNGKMVKGEDTRVAPKNYSPISFSRSRDSSKNTWTWWLQCKLFLSPQLE